MRIHVRRGWSWLWMPRWGVYWWGRMAWWGFWSVCLDLEDSPGRVHFEFTKHEKLWRGHPDYVGGKA